MNFSLGDWKFYVFIFGLGVMWASMSSALASHVAEMQALLSVEKEVCYAVHKHAGLDPLACYDDKFRGAKR